MQIKKDEIHRRLLHAGLQEFLNKGFEKTSVRSIVKTANTTVGNFYNYFKSKENLFSELVDDVYQKFVCLIEHHNDQYAQADSIKIQDIAIWREKLKVLLEPLIPLLDDRFLLLLDKSQGTKYADAKQQLITFISGHFIDHIYGLAPDYPYPQMGRYLALELVSGIIEIIKNTKDKTTKHQLIIEQMLFTGIGVMGLLQGGRNDQN